MSPAHPTRPSQIADPNCSNHFPRVGKRQEDAMQERDTPAKDDFVMSGKQEDREESYDYSNAEGGGAKRSMKPIVVAGVVLLSAIIVVLMFLSGSPRSAEKDQLRNMDARL